MTANGRHYNEQHRQKYIFLSEPPAEHKSHVSPLRAVPLEIIHLDIFLKPAHEAGYSMDLFGRPQTVELAAGTILTTKNPRQACKACREF